VKTKYTFFLLLMVVAVLIGLYFLPQLTVFGYDLRQVNILSDVMTDSAETDSAKVEEEPIPVFIATEDSVPPGMIPIEDFHDSLGIHREMDKFYAALHDAKHRVVRIAYFGDSFIEGDILTAHIRELLQQEYGGQGVGFVDIQSPIAGFRTTVVEYSSGWNEYNVVSSGRGFNKQLQGISSRYFTPMGPTAQINMRGQTRIFPEHLDTVEMATLFFTPQDGLELQYAVNKGKKSPFYHLTDSTEWTFQADSLETDSMEADSMKVEPIEAVTTTGQIGRIEITVNGRGRFYGLALEGRHGIVLDNFSMRSSNGWHLGTIPMATLRQFAQLRPYDLIIMHYGLNTATVATHRYTAYCERFKKGIDHLREAFPQASLLVFSMSNRDVRDTGGAFHTMDGVTQLVDAQRNMAREEGIAFWNLQQGMGGSGSMERLQKAGRANRDYTHINFRGGEVIGKTFFDVLMNGKENYERRVKANPRHYELRDDSLTTEQHADD